MEGARLDSPRRLPNLIRICEKLGQHAGKSLSAALGDATRQACYDLCSRSRRVFTDLIAGHVAQTVLRCRTAAAADPIIVTQDSVCLDYFTHRGCKGLGPVTNSADSYGLWAHSALAWSPTGVPLGVLDLQFWVRDAACHGQRALRHTRSAEEKETEAWASTARAVIDAFDAEPVPLVLVQDRGADLYAFLMTPRPPQVQFVVRAYQPRRAQRLPDGPADLAVSAEALGPPKALPQLWSEAPVRVARWEVDVTGTPATPKRPARPDRKAQVEIRSARVRLLRPQTAEARRGQWRNLVWWAVWVRELDPPAGETALAWLLLTTLDAGSAGGALLVVQTYAKRWGIERLHRVLKSGLRVERYQVDDVTSLQNILSLSWVVAWRILQLTEVVRATPEVPPEAWLGDSELAVLTAKFGRRPTTVREALRLVAKFGGWPGATRKQDPGTDVLWRGFHDLAVAVATWDLARDTFSPTPTPHDTS
jgi:hypothetical protein